MIVANKGNTGPQAPDVVDVGYEQQHQFSLLLITSQSYLQPEFGMFMDMPSVLEK